MLGPLLFLVYVNDIVNALDGVTPRLFADDTNLFLYSKNLNLLEIESNKAIANIAEWMTANKLSVNIGKTCYQFFNPHPKLPSTNLSLKLNGIEIERNHIVKYLGIYIDEDLKWSKHIKFVYEV